MRNRLTRALCARLFAALCTGLLSEQASLAGRVTLEDGSTVVTFDSKSGALTRLENKTAHWTIERRPELGVSFRLFVPLPERRWNPVLGQKQRAAEVKKLSDHEVVLKWKDLKSESDGVLPITFTSHVTLTNGALTFSAVLDNASGLTVETIDYPYFGDFNPPARDTTNMTAQIMQPGKPDNLMSREIYPRFNNEKGYWGVFWPTKMLDAGQSPFCLIQAPKEGLYVALADGKSPYRLQYTFEQHPGLVSGITQMVPKEDEIGGQAVHLEFRTCHFIFAPPHSTTNLTPIVLRGYQGDWRSGMNLFQQSAQGK